MKRTIAAAGILSLALLGTAGTAYASPAGSDTEVHSGTTTQGSTTPGDGTKTPGKDNQHGSGGWTGGGTGNSDHQGGGGNGGDKGDHGGGWGGGGNGGDKGDHGGGWGGGNGGDKGDHGGGWGGGNGGGNGDEGDCDTPSDPPVEPTTPPTTPPVVTPPVVTPPVVTPPVVTPPVVTPPAVQQPAVIPAGAAAAVQPAPAVNAGYNVQTAAGSTDHGLPVWLGYFAFGVGTTGGGKGPVSGSPAGASQLASPLSVPATGHALPLRTTPALPSPAVTPATPTAIPAAPAIAAAPARPAAAEPLRVSYPAAGIDVPVHPLQPTAGEAASQSIVPPETKDGYWLTPFGSPGTGSTNTTYIIGHSWVDQDAPFNHLSTAAAPGGVLTVTTAGGALSYRVDSIATYSKAELKDSPIWEVVPDRLVLISCYTEDPWGRNVVVVASPL